MLRIFGSQFKIKWLFPMVCCFLAFSCQNSGPSSNSQKSSEQKQDTTHQEEPAESLELTLDNGQKWAVNPEMTPFISNGNVMVDEYLAKGKTDYKKLAKYLKQQDDSLISSCTMTGTSHEVLHVWLHPHLELVKELADAPNEEEAGKLVTQIQKSYTAYNQYFQ